MDWLSLSKVPGNPPRRTSTRSLPILKAGVDSQYRHTFQKAQPSKVPLKHILRTDARLLPGSTIHPNTRSDGSKLLECGEKKGETNLFRYMYVFFLKKENKFCLNFDAVSSTRHFS